MFGRNYVLSQKETPPDTVSGFRNWWDKLPPAPCLIYFPRGTNLVLNADGEGVGIHMGSVTSLANDQVKGFCQHLTQAAQTSGLELLHPIEMGGATVAQTVGASDR